MSLLPDRSRILIVDDTPSYIIALREALKDDHDVVFATNGRDALKIAASNEPPDLILLDIMMPEMDGYEVCRVLKADPLTGNIPVIFLTVRSEEPYETKGFEIGAVDYITKPFSIPIVKARVSTHLQLKRQRDILENLSSVDGLTGVANRRRFEEVLELEWRRGVRHSTWLSVILIDIDFFKAFNDNFGHLAGDECLKRVAQTLAGSVQRAEDFVARYGGEEFVVIAPGTDLAGACVIAERLRVAIQSLEAHQVGSRLPGAITISLGVASTVPGRNSSRESLMAEADKMLYEAKARSRNQVKGIELR